MFNLFLLIAIAAAGRSRSRDSRPSNRRYGWATPSPVTTTLSPTPPSNDQLCGCFDIYTDSIQNGDQICYYYHINRISDADYCQDAIDYIAFDNGDNLDQCGLDSMSIDDIITGSSGKCNSIDTDYSSGNVNGIKIKIDGNDGKSSGSGSKSKRGDDDRRRLRRRYTSIFYIFYHILSDICT